MITFLDSGYENNSNSAEILGHDLFHTTLGKGGNGQGGFVAAVHPGMSAASTT